jgi:hypothetical protein
MRQEVPTENQPRAPRRAEEWNRDRGMYADRAKELRERWDRLGGDPENPLICRGID